MFYVNQHLEQPVVFESCGIFMADQRWRHEKRIIDSYEIIIVYNGTLSMRVNNTCFDVHENEMLIIPPFNYHEGVNYSEKGLRFFWCHFSNISFEQMSKETVEALSNNETFAQMLLLPEFTNKISVNRANILFHQLLDIYQETQNGMYLNYFMTSILMELSYQTHTSYFPNGRKDNSNITQPIRDWVRIHALEHITVESIAEEFRYNKSYLSRMFKENEGISIKELITKYRIEYAKSMLMNTSKDIIEIAYEAGYVDPKYFMRVFKRVEQVTPTVYRRTFAQKHFNNK